MKNLLSLLALTLVVSSANAQKKKKQDIEAIKSMCGCYEVTFNFAETFAPDTAYAFHDNYRAKALEYVLPIEEGKDKIVLQHLLVIGDTMIIKHWRQDWLYENMDFYTYQKDNTWGYEKKPESEVKGQWTQKVYQVDDGLRYEASASWVHADGKHFWESTADAPLPRREFSKRKDYNVMVRRNRQEITEYGWNHEQDNDKVIRGQSSDKLLAQEKGMNYYEKVDMDKCKVAASWWAKNHHYWKDVRLVWSQLFASKKTLAFNMKVDDKILFQRLFELGKAMPAKGYSSEKAQSKIKHVLQLHLKGDMSLAKN